MRVGRRTFVKHFFVTGGIFSLLLAFVTSVDTVSYMSSLLLTQVSIPERVSAEEFVEWMIAEPQTIVWLPTLHRLAVSETGTICLIPVTVKAPVSGHHGEAVASEACRLLKRSS